MAHEQDQWVTTLARIREHADALLARSDGPSTWSPVQRERQDLLDIVDMLSAQLAAATARVKVADLMLREAAQNSRYLEDAKQARCTCGHWRESHEHYRSASNCSLCDCHHYRAARSVLYPFDSPERV